MAALASVGTIGELGSFAAESPVPHPPTARSIEEVFGSDRARKTLLNFPARGERTDLSVPAKSPSETVASFKLMAGLVGEAALAEPLVRQPVFLNFDEQGRMWVVQFLQYPYPAGVKIIDFDDQFHAVYDRVPPAPPRHDRGADRITIHEDRDGDGMFETHKVFLEGLNMVTAVERGRGGVWVLNPPYLVFWPDRNQDDRVDGEPVVHLAGFGLEDTHSAANSLRWGPDGWLYGGQGSGVSATIWRPGVDDSGAGFYFKGQAIWRYHPETRAFELFSEGGGNTFGLEFDSAGRVYSGINGNNHRGFHFVQGGYYSKNFGEHGYFTNPNTFGYFSAMEHDRPIPRFSHTFVIYEGGALGGQFEGRLIAPVPLRNHVALSQLLPRGSTYSTRDEGFFLESNDRWFRPVDIKVGPDGAVYIADWYDTRLSHMDPRDTWDRQHGRIYRIKASQAPASRRLDLSKLSGRELVELLGHRNKWHRQQALRLLADRRDRSLIKSLAGLALQPGNPRAVDALWGLHAVNGLDVETAINLLNHVQPVVRRAAVQWVGDQWGRDTAGLPAQVKPAPVPEKLADVMLALARNELDGQVQSQLASSAKRLPAPLGLSMVWELTRHEAANSDPHIPLLIWWAIEAKCMTHPELIGAAFETPEIWSRAIVRNHLLSRLARRYAGLPTLQNQEMLARLLRYAPDEGARKLLLAGINEAFKGGGAEVLTRSLEQLIGQADASGNRDAAQLALAIRKGEPRAIAEALALVAQERNTLEADRVQLIQSLGDSGRRESTSVLLEVLAASSSRAVREAALHALSRFDAPELVDELLLRWSSLDQPLRQNAVVVMATRKNWARRFLGAVGGSGAVSKQDVPDELVQRFRLLGDPEVASLCDRFFGKVAAASSEAKQKRIAEIAQVLKESRHGDVEAGQALYQARCAACHELFGQGGKIGPELTGYERTNLENMLLNIVDPNVSIREGYTLFQVTTKDGRELVGFIVDRDGARITLRDPAGTTQIVPLDQVQREQAAGISLMPEGLIDDLSPQQLRDFFAYLTASAVPK